MRHEMLWLLVVVLIFFAANRAAADFSYAGAVSCKKCHRGVFNSWQETTMAKAFDILKPGMRAGMKSKAGLDPGKDYTRDADCLSCHVTGFGRAGGFVSMERTPELAGVGCESCHGAGTEYNRVMEKRGRIYSAEEVEQAGLVRDIRSGCVACHNDRSPTRGFQPPFRAADYPWPGHAEVKLKYHTPEYQVNK